MYIIKNMLINLTVLFTTIQQNSFLIKVILSLLSLQVEYKLNIVNNIKSIFLQQIIASANTISRDAVLCSFYTCSMHLQRMRMMHTVVRWQYLSIIRTSYTSTHLSTRCKRANYDPEKLWNLTTHWFAGFAVRSLITVR